MQLLVTTFRINVCLRIYRYRLLLGPNFTLFKTTDFSSEMIKWNQFLQETVYTVYIQHIYSSIQVVYIVTVN